MTLRTVGLALTALAPAAWAIYPDVAATSPFLNVGMVGSGSFSQEGSGVPVGPRHILTAAHLGGRDNPLSGARFMLNGELYLPVARVRNDGADLAITTLDHDLPNWYQIAYLNEATMQGRSGALVGFGLTGNLRVNGTGYDLVPGTKGTRRLGFNVLGLRQQVSYTIAVAHNPFVWLWDLDKAGFADALGDGAAIPGEANVAEGDSGGAVFVQQNGVWQLGGIIVITWSNATSFGQGGGGAVDLNQYRNWIEQTLPPKILSTGVANLQNFGGSPTTQTLRMEVRATGSTTPLEVYTLSPDAANNISLRTYRVGAHDVWLKGPHWLAQKVNVALTDTGVTNLGFSLRNGDVNGDNSVNLADFLALRAAFGTSSGSPNWNPNADLNGDGSVNVADFVILRANFGQSGAA
ncbi:MAG: hypothetical protein KIS66_08145 [Fimbriimonadaceae bacterium]|nr:hypothetical protein [Fimbriimonadaceae bacterium]